MNAEAPCTINIVLKYEISRNSSVCSVFLHGMTRRATERMVEKGDLIVLFCRSGLIRCTMVAHHTGRRGH